MLPRWLDLLWWRIKGVFTSVPCPLYRGVDISFWNGDVDFQALRKKVDFAILRCGYGGDYKSQDDSRFARNVQLCDQAGLPYGVYLYAYAENKEMAIDEAKHVIRLIKGTDPAFGVWYDVEENSLPYGPGLASACKAWCDAVAAAGITCVGIYASLDRMRDYFSGPELASYEKWVAQWEKSCEYPNPGMWQYAEADPEEGRYFDLDYAYKNYPDITGANMTPETFKKMMEGYLAAESQEAVHEWAARSWEKARKSKAFDGSAPQSPLTREQAAIVLDRLKLLDS